MDSVEENNEISDLVYKILNNFLNKEYGQGKYKYDIKGATKKGDNYLGVVYRITVKMLDNEDNRHQLILKVPPQNLLRREKFFARPVFLREALAFEKFFPLISDFQQAKGLSIQESFHEYPKYKFSSTDYMNEVICMDDLQPQGFYLFDRFAPLTYDHVTILMRIYGKLHATSLVIKDENPELLSELQKMQDIFVQQKDYEPLNNYFESLKVNVLECIDKQREHDYWSKLNEYLNSATIFELMLSILDSKSSEPYSVICHGDCWINNIMYKYENDRIKDACLIDWQIMRYASPVIDLMYFLMCCTTGEFRQKYFQNMIDIYHKSATDHIKRLGADADKLYSRIGLDKELRGKGAIGLLFATFVLPILTTRSEDVPDLEILSEKVAAGQTIDIKDSGIHGENATLYNKRMHDVVTDTIDYGWI
uniref:CHK domain-containing protein n=1 Tax=Glossina austeni TaxID=7395 RepID=A0A1A9VLX7_GLOAU